MTEPVQPSPDEVAAWKRAYELVSDKWNDPSIGKTLREAAKQKFPDVPAVPGLDERIDPILAPMRAENESMRNAMAAMQAERAAEKKAAEDAALQAKLSNSIDAAVNKFGLTDEGRAKMMERMQQTGNYGDPEAAAAWFVQSNPPPPPPGPTWSPQDLNLFGSKETDERFALLHKDPTGKFFDAEMAEFYRDPDGYTRGAGIQVGPR